MIQKEINELRRRLAPGKNNISKIYGCFVNGNREIVSYLDESLGQISELEIEKYMGMLKKAISGKLGKNLIDIVFSTQQVQDSDEHCRLMALKTSELKDTEAREAFYRNVIESLDMDGSNYLLLLACDSYDVPHRGKDDEIDTDASDEVFTYYVCAICPVKDGKPELGYFSGENEFHGYATNQIVAAPELGFLFPAFDNRTANIYNALFYSKNASQIHQDFIDGVFHIEAPMSAQEQKDAFQTALSDALEDACSYDVAQAVHEQMNERIAQHEETKNPEPLEITTRDVGQMLQNAGVPAEKIEAFQAKCNEDFGEGAVLNPTNLVETSKFEVATEQVKITVAPEYSYLVETRVVDGKKYIMIPADEGVEVNGLSVKVKTE